MKAIVISILFFASLSLMGQNLVPNGGFETYTSLPSDPGQWHFVQGWTNAGGTPVSGYYADPDYFHLNGSGVVQLPNPSPADVHPHSDSAIMGFLGYHDPSVGATDIREYLMVELASPLVIGGDYTLSFWITNGASDIGHYYKCNHIGAHLSTQPLQQSGTSYIPRTPQVEIPGELFTTEWTLQSFTFTADSNYRYLTLGNFYSDAQTSKSVALSGPLPFAGAYYFVDDVAVERQSKSSVAEPLSDLFSVSPNPATDHLHIRLMQGSSKGVVYRLYSLQGTVLREGRIWESAEIAVDDLAAGTYLLQVERDAEKVIRRVVIEN